MTLFKGCIPAEYGLIVRKKIIWVLVSLIHIAKSYISWGTKVAYHAKTHIFFAPERYTAGILYTDSLNSA